MPHRATLITAVFAAAALTAACSQGAPPPAPPPPPATATDTAPPPAPRSAPRDPHRVAAWMEFAAGLRPGWYDRTPATARADAVLALAMFEAANAVSGEYAPFLPARGLAPDTNSNSAPAPATPPTPHVAAALSAAAAHTLTLLYPEHATAIAAFHRDHQGPDPAARSHSDDLAARQVAQHVYARGATTKHFGVAYPRVEKPRATPAPGVYVPQWEQSAIRSFDLSYVPWTFDRPDRFRPGPPPGLHTPAFAAAYQEAKALGPAHGSTRTAAQTETARFWFLIEMNPVLRDIAQTPGRTLTQNARMYARFHMATDDAWSAAADAKAFHLFWRPITAIAQARRDGNPHTQPQDGWAPLSPTPPHPEYPAGHCVQAAAQALVLQTESEHPQRRFTFISSELPEAAPRRLTLGQYVEQTSASRLYAGAHFRFSNDAGEALGRQVGQQVLTRWAAGR